MIFFLAVMRSVLLTFFTAFFTTASSGTCGGRRTAAPAAVVHERDASQAVLPPRDAHSGEYSAACEESRASCCLCTLSVHFLACLSDMAKTRFWNKTTGAWHYGPSNAVCKDRSRRSLASFPGLCDAIKFFDDEDLAVYTLACLRTEMTAAEQLLDLAPAVR